MGVLGVPLRTVVIRGAVEEVWGVGEGAGDREGVGGEGNGEVRVW